jgi:hypothetical protein
MATFGFSGSKDSKKTTNKHGKPKAKKPGK